jgi:hypothetical protein
MIPARPLATCSPFRLALARVAAVGVIVLSTRSGRAADTARLVFLRGQNTETCPDEQALRDSVAARLGYDPFNPWAPNTLFMELERDGNGFVARIKLVTRENLVRGARTLRATSSCADLVPTLGLTISLAIDPMGEARSHPPEGLPPSERPVTPIESHDVATDARLPSDDLTTEQRPEAPSTPVRLSVGLGGLGSIGTAASPAIGGILFGGARWRDLSVSVEVHADVPASAEASSSGRVSSLIVAGALLPCHHTDAFFACGRGELGAISAKGLDVSSPGSKSALWAEVGGRIGYELPFDRTFALRAHVDGGVVLTRYQLRLGGEKVFEHPLFCAGLGISLAVHLP